MANVEQIEAGGRPELDEPQDQCGVVGVIEFEPQGDVARLTFEGTHAVQKRGYHAGGLKMSDGSPFRGHKGLGRIIGVYPDGGQQHDINYPLDTIGVGQVRYGTMEDIPADVDLRSAQPVVSPDGRYTFAHNGEISNAFPLAVSYGRSPDGRVSDSVTAGETLFARADELAALGIDQPLRAAALEILPRLEGAFTLVFSDGETLYAARDTHGYKPGSIGELPDGNGYMVSSETVSFDQAGALLSDDIAFHRDIRPGELISINKEHGLQSELFAEPEEERLCGLEVAYIMNVMSKLGDGKVILGDLRQNQVGRQLAREQGVDVPEDYVVVPIPETGIPAALGYADELKIEVAHLIQKIGDGRTFLESSQSLRQLGVGSKFALNIEALKDIVARGKKIVCVDDSIFRGNTTVGVNDLIDTVCQELGIPTPERHWRSPYPKVISDCGRGVALGKVKELIARLSEEDGTFVRERTDEEIAPLLHAASVGYISVEGFIGAVKKDVGGLCLKCVTEPEDDLSAGRKKLSLSLA